MNYLEEKKLREFHIEVAHYDLNNFKVNNDFKQMLKFDRKSKTNKTVALVLTSIAAIRFVGRTYIF
jgi:hypothetical protein